MAHLFHRRLITHPKDIQAKAERLTHTYGSLDKWAYPDTIGEFWTPFHHNYAYGLSKIQVVANLLADMKVTSASAFLVFYNDYLQDSWVDEERKKTYENLVTAMGGMDSDQSLVLFAEHFMNDQKKIIDDSNTWHLIFHAINAYTLLSIFGFDMTMNITLWILLSGIVVSEAMSKTMPVSGSSIISFEVTGAVFLGMMFMKRWNMLQTFTFALTVYAFLAPLIEDPPLMSKYFLVGKSILHLAHFVGAGIGAGIVFFVS